MLVRPVADIASFPAPGWTTAPLWSKVNSVDPDDTTFITGLAPGAQDPQVAIQLGDLEIPYGASGQIIVRVRMRWSAALTANPDTVRIGLAPAADLGVTDPTLTFERSVLSFTSTDFVTVEMVFDYTDWVGDSSAFGVYVEMDPDDADTTQFGQIAWVEVESCIPAVVIGDCPLGSITAEAVIQEARDQHPAFEKRSNPNGLLLRALSSYQRTVYGKVARINPALLATPVTVTLPLDDFDDGCVLPAFHYVMPGVEARLAANTDIVETVELVPLAMRTRTDSEMQARSVYLRGSTLYLSGRASHWDTYSSLTLHAVLVPEELTALSDVLGLPDWGMDAYVAALASLMATRMGLRDAVFAAASDMEQQFLDTVAQQRAAETSYTRDDFGGW